MANRLEATCWDHANNKPVAPLDGISHVTVRRGPEKEVKDKAFLTDSMLEAHRINSPFILSSSDRTFLDPFLNGLRNELGQSVIDNNEGLIQRKGLAATILRFDVGGLIHGVFFANNKVKLTATAKPTSIAGGRLRIARALSAFVEAKGVQVAASGGVKNDHVHPGSVQGDLSELIGNVPFARDEFTAESIECHINLDLAQIRGYGLGADVERLLILLSLYKVRKLLDGDMRLRTACDLEPVDRDNITAKRPDGFALPVLTDIEAALSGAITKCTDKMEHTTVAFDDVLKKGKRDADTGSAADDEPAEAENDED